MRIFATATMWTQACILAFAAGVTFIAPNINAAAIESCDVNSPGLIHCGSAPSATFSDDGSLWVVFEYQQHVWLTKSRDDGRQFDVAIRVTDEPENIETNGENRPKIIVDDDSGSLFVSWTQKTEGMHTGDIRYTYSTDMGSTFEPVRTVNDDGLLTSHRFESMLLTDEGRLYITWLDKRNLEYAKERGEEYRGSGVFYTYSDDNGRSFAPNQKIADHSCECCRIAVAPHGDNGMALMWRHVFDVNTRDHAIATVNGSDVTSVNRATVDDWQIDACPHHGPSMVPADSSETYHMSWFSAGDTHRGLYYGRHDVAIGETSRVKQMDGRPGAGHPSLAVEDDVLHMVWKRFNGVATDLILVSSSDDGTSWSEESVLATTEGGSDHPLLVQGPEGLRVSWMTHEDGYKFVRIADSKPDIRAFTTTTFEDIKTQREGQPFVLALWSVTCPPCMVELDMFGELLKEQPGLPLVLVSTDDIEGMEDALDFLYDYELDGITSWMFADSFTERLRYSIDPNWFGELPRSYYFNENHAAEAHSGILQEDQVRYWLSL
ncbi:hypothetical protein PS2015_1112 [Pseudohongiella spirulinae]|uniref:Thioredoxin domain-containing protein n=2 Tax=Pseudohongiella spirulinae TaxID=1249552 RepID=A0A0S2KCG9_9GAMM|nr:hypothetical protein PS2015_1112 [Pseudohongiella spirulinae]